METLNRLLIVIRQTMEEVLRVSWCDLNFARADTAVFLVVALLAISLFMALARRLWRRNAAGTHISLPAIVPDLAS